MQENNSVSGRSWACPIGLMNRLSQVADSAMPVGASLGCPQTEETVEKLGADLKFSFLLDHHSC